jgi:hypothetical protein
MNATIGARFAASTRPMPLAPYPMASIAAVIATGNIMSPHSDTVLARK